MNTIKFFVFLAAIGLNVRAYAAELVCNRLSRATHTIHYNRTNINGTVLRLPAPITTFQATPSRVPAGPKGEALKPGECGLKDAGFAPRYTNIILHVINGERFQMVHNEQGGTRGGWDGLAGSNAKIFSFEGDFQTAPSYLTFNLDLSKNSVIFY
jgi:hypothetical protein